MLGRNTRNVLKMVSLSPPSVAILSAITLSLGMPSMGNLDAALNAVFSNPESITCNLDNQNIQEGQSSCQQLDKVVRFRAGNVMTFNQDWGGSVSTGAAIWNGANMAGWFMENVLGSHSLSGASVLELGAGTAVGRNGRHALVLVYYLC